METSFAFLAAGFGFGAFSRRVRIPEFIKALSRLAVTMSYSALDPQEARR